MENNYIAYKKDCTLSIALNKKHKKVIQPKGCFKNTWDIAFEGAALLEHPSWLVAYGCMPLHVQPLYCQHAFFLDTETGVVIDPTVPTRQDESDAFPYYVAIAFTAKEFIQAVTKQKGEIDPNTNGVIRPKIRALELWLREQGMFCCG